MANRRCLHDVAQVFKIDYVDTEKALNYSSRSITLFVTWSDVISDTKLIFIRLFFVHVDKQNE